MSFIDTSNEWYLIAADPSLTINVTALTLSLNNFDVSLAVISLGNTISHGLPLGSNGMSDISTHTINNLSTLGSTRQGIGDSFEKKDWGNIIDFSNGTINKPMGIWVLTKDY